MSETTNINFLFGDALTRSSLDTFVDECFDFGCTTRQDGQTDTVSYLGALTDHDFDYVGLEEALSDIDRHEYGSFQLRCNGVVLLAYVNTTGNDGRPFPGVPIISLSVDRVYFHDEVEIDIPTIDETVRTLTGLTTHLSAAMDPIHVAGYNSASDSAYEEYPFLDFGLDELRTREIPDVFWLNIYRPADVEQFGRETLLSAPVWQVQELPDGSILLVMTESPYRIDYDTRGRVRTHLGLDD
ncbi:hypothetical protein ACFQH6_18695 [Halobacteriaceae archaeon GCM10025711]